MHTTAAAALYVTYRAGIHIQNWSWSSYSVICELFAKFRTEANADWNSTDSESNEDVRVSTMFEFIFVPTDFDLWRTAIRSPDLHPHNACNYIDYYSFTYPKGM